MKLKQHLIIGGAAAITLYFYRDWALWRAVLFFVSSVLIDTDHYWDYLWRSKFKDWSGWRMFRYYDLLKKSYNDKRFFAVSILHTAEFFLAVYALARFWDYRFFMTIFWGMLFHLFLDIITFVYEGKPFLRAYSLAEYWIRKRWLIRQGINPDAFYKEIFEKSKTACLAGRPFTEKQIFKP